MYWKEKILPAYEIRKSREQKSAFIGMLRENYGERMTVEESKSFGKSRNIILGDPEKAKVVFTAHYDTCARLPFPNFITPKNFFFYIVYQLLLVVVLLVPAFGAVYLSSKLVMPFSDIAALIISEVAAYAVFALELWLMLAGPANTHTANDNTSGVVTVLTLADKLGFDDFAYILFDNEEMGLLGSAAYVKAHPTVKKNTLIVNFDCVSDGDNMLMAFSKSARETEVYKNVSERADAVMKKYNKTPVVTKAETTIYPSDQKAFAKSVAVAALNKAKFIGLYMDKIHTPKDTVFIEDNIEALVELFSEAADQTR